MAIYEGELNHISDAVANPMSNSVRVPALRIGGAVLRSTVMNDELFALLVPGQHYRLAFGRLLLWRWLLRLETLGEVHRCGIVSLLFFNGVHAWLGGIAAIVLSAVAFSSHSAQESIAVIAGLVLFGLNVKVWVR